MATTDAMRSRGDDTRRRVLDAAMEEFAHRGFGGASLASIASKAAVSKPSLLHHFRSKDHLLEAVLTERNTRAAMGISHADLHDARGLAVFDALDRLVGVNATRPLYVRLGHMVRMEAPSEGNGVADAAARHHDEARAIVLRALRAGVDDGEIRPDVDLDLVAVEAVAVMEGLENQWLSDPDRIDMVASYHRYSARLRAELRRRDP